MDPVISEIKYLGGGTLDFVEVRIPDDYPDPENLVLVIYDRNDDGSTTATPSANDMYAIADVGDTSDDTSADGFTHYIIGTDYDGTAIALHANDAVGLYNSATGETYGIFSFGDAYTVSTAALQPDGVTADPFAGDVTTTLPANAAIGDSLIRNTDGTYSTTTTPTPGDSFVCFVSGATILTQKGPVLVEHLQVGDKVLTMDNGYQPIRWIGARSFDSIDLAINPRLGPIRICAGSLAPNMPEKDLLVSRQHRILVRSIVAQRMFGAREVLIPATKLKDLNGVQAEQNLTNVTYHHFMFDDHEVVFSNGAPTESMSLGKEALKSVGIKALKEITSIFPEVLSDEFTPSLARSCPTKGSMITKMTARINKNRKLAVESLAKI